METKPLHKLFGEDKQFTTDSLDIGYIEGAYLKQLQEVGIEDNEITGLVTQQDQGDYIEIWVTTSSRPYDIKANYTKIL